MTETTVLDHAHAAMDAAPDDDAARLRFYARFADSELFLLLDEDAADTLAPAIFDLPDGRFAMVFDLEERLGAFCDAPAAYAALPGRVVVAQLGGKGVGIGLNLGVAPSAFLMPAEAVDWLAGTLGGGPSRAARRPLRLRPPELAAPVVATLSDAVARMAGLATAALLARAGYGSEGEGHLLAIEGAAPEAGPKLAGAVRDALVFSGIPEAAVDVAFPAPDDPLWKDLDAVALRLDIRARRTAVPAPAPAPAPAGPGTDPDRPPRLR